MLAPLGRLTAARLRALLPAGEVRLTPWRGVVVAGADPARLPALEAAGLITRPDSPWAGVTACTGRPGCAKSLADVRADAAPDPAREHPGGPVAPPSPSTTPGASAAADTRTATGPTSSPPPAATTWWTASPPPYRPARSRDRGPHDEMSESKRMFDYEKDGAEIYRQSFATIRAEADLAGLPADVAQVAVRMIHACGMTDLVRDIAWSPQVVTNARAALRAGAPILCDAQMVASGVTRRRLPADNEVICTLSDPSVPDLAAELGTTRSAAALELWRDRLEGSVVAIGNAPTALFHLLQMVAKGAGKPAAVLGIPVGFIGAAESKDALAAQDLGLDYLVVRGRRGGSAMTAAAINAIAHEAEIQA